MRTEFRPLRAAFAPLLFALAAGLSGLIAAPATPAAESAIPRPAALDRDVQFWIRVYSEITTNDGFLHDENNLGVVYETVHFPPNTLPHERESVLEAARDHYAAALRHIAATISAPKPPPAATTAVEASAVALPVDGAVPAPAAPAPAAQAPPTALPAALPAAPEAALTAEERRILDLWGTEGTPERLLQATKTIRFQLGQGDRFRAGLVRSGAWEGHIADTLANLGLPPEIAVLPHVESSFNPAAYSKVGAAGLWQFMRSTGRRYLRIDAAVDERLDPFRSTEAAAQLLAYNYRILGSWPLAITAYNHGAAGMRRARDTLGTEDIAVIARNYKGPTFGFASRNFYVSFLAALTIEQSPEKYFGPIERVPEQRFREIPCPAFVPVAALERTLKIDRDTLRQLNPALQPAVWEGQRLVPRGYLLRLPQQANDWSGERLAARLPAADQFVAQIQSRAHRVKRGDTLERVAARYGLSPQLVADLNRLEPGAALRPGRTLRLPDRKPALMASSGGSAASTGAAGGSGPAVGTDAAAGESAAGSAGLYVVRRGESLSDIAARVGVSQAELMRFNRLRDSDFIFEGQKLRVAAEKNAEAADAEANAPAATLAAGDPPAAPPAPIVPSAPPPPAPPPPVSRSQAEAQGPALVPGVAAGPQVTDSVDYAVARDGSVRVAAAETLGHYADWLGLRAAKLRSLNHLRPGRPLLLGQRVKLAFDAVTREQFEQRRRDYHVRLQSDFFDSHRINGTELYIARRGDSLWSVTQRYPRLPAWLLQEYNPDTDLGELRPGTQLVVPRVEEAAAAN